MSSIAELSREYTLFSWSAQAAVRPIPVERAEGVYFWDSEGKRYLDWNSQLMNVNIGHGNRRVIESIAAQARELAYIAPGNTATRIRAEVGRKLAEIAPGGLRKTFFTLGGGDAIENAMKAARLYTGREKIVTRYRSFHGGTWGAATAGGDPRRLANEPGVPWIVRVHDPYRYRCLFCRELDACNLMCEEHIEQTIHYEGPENVAAVMLEGWSGSSGIIQAPRNQEYFQRLREFCDRHGILLIVDEVMSGFGRTGKWFAIEHAGVEPDIMVVAKGLTSGYLPLGAMLLNERISQYFEENVFWGGLTYSGHPTCLAAASACIDVYREENLIERAATRGESLARQLANLQERHPSVGEVRGVGLFYAIELVRDRESREPLSGWNAPSSEAMRRIQEYFREHGLYAYVRWNWIFCAPPLIISEEEIEEGVRIIDGALSLADHYYEGVAPARQQSE